MADLTKYPQALREVLELFVENPGERNAMLIEYSDQFRGVPERIARRPYPEANLVPHCESETYVFIEPGADGRLTYHFAVENPFGVSARALSAILDQTVNGLAAAEIAGMPIEDIVPTLFGRNISMGKGQGLVSVVAVVKKMAQDYIKQRASA